MSSKQKEFVKSNNTQDKDIQQASKLIHQGKLKEAELIYRKLIQEGIRNEVIFSNLAAVCGIEGKKQEMVELLKKALSIKSNYPDALYNLGYILQEQGDLEAAIASYRKALSIKPNYPDALYNLGIALKRKGNLEAAIASYRKALAIKPNYPEALNNLGNVLNRQGDLEAAIASYRKALTIKPNYPEALSNLGNVLQKQGNLEDAITFYKKALSINSYYPNARLNLSYILLLSGDYENGWKDYEWRFHKREAAKPHAHPQVKQWNGHNHSSEEKLILVSEQGLGDTLQFMRYVPYLRSMGMDVSLCAPPKLHSLIQSSGITTALYTPEEANTITTGKWLPLLSLPGYLNVRPDNPLVDTPYIKVPKQKILEWKQKLAAEKRPIIGINWQGNPQIEKTNLAGRSLPLSAFAPIIETTRVSLLSLQKGFGSEQLTDCSFLHRFVDCQGEISQIWDFVETAAIILNCDLIITSDTVVAHLAGGLGKPTWLLLKNIPDWRWGIAGEISFWYPSMRLFRQQERGNWPEVMQRVATALESFTSNCADTPAPAKKAIAISIPVSLAELLDKITILEIKSKQFCGEQKKNVDHELSLLKHVLRQSGVELLPEQQQQLKAVNQSLWQIEESIREHERRKDFDEAFIALARS
ncbi:MAG: tetratricopeptide repeat protein, partial [Aphanocapsa feldmannii 288cV]